jgi:hypothetical protein
MGVELSASVVLGGHPWSGSLIAGRVLTKL